MVVANYGVLQSLLDGRVRRVGAARHRADSAGRDGGAGAVGGAAEARRPHVALAVADCCHELLAQAVVFRDGRWHLRDWRAKHKTATLIRS